MIRSAISSVLRRTCESIAKRLDSPRIIQDRDGISPYLSRYYLVGGAFMPDGSPPFDAEGNPREGAIFDDKLPFQLYLHKFHRGDDDLALHNHPWSWSLSFILAGGYKEERRFEEKRMLYPSYRVLYSFVRPLSFNFIRGNDFHRVELLEKDAWTLFLVGPRTQGWGFWDRHTGEFLPWRQFIAKKRQEEVSVTNR